MNSNLSYKNIKIQVITIITQRIRDVLKYINAPSNKILNLNTQILILLKILVETALDKSRQLMSVMSLS